MKIVKCDICKEEIPDGNRHMVVTRAFNAPIAYNNDKGLLVCDTNLRSFDICMDCWEKIYNFANVYSEDPHVKLIREDGEPV